MLVGGQQMDKQVSVCSIIDTSIVSEYHCKLNHVGTGLSIVCEPKAVCGDVNNHKVTDIYCGANTSFATTGKNNVKTIYLKNNVSFVKKS